MSQYEQTASDYEPVTPLGRPRAFGGGGAGASREGARDEEGGAASAQVSSASTTRESGASVRQDGADAAGGGESAPPGVARRREWPALRRGHAVSFVGLLLFTAAVYFRPQDWVPGLTSFKTIAFWLATLTLVVFIPAQLGLEGSLTARPREVNYVLLLLLAGLISVPLALDPAEAWPGWVDYAKVITMFVVMVNVVRSERRLRWMLWLALAVSVLLSVSAVNDYHAGRLKLGGDRIEGAIGGLFENPNDLALHLVTMIPLALGLLLVARGFVRKALYGGVTCLMLLGTFVTYSRGGLLGLGCASFLMAWKLKRRNRALVVAGFVVAAALFLVVAPPDFLMRLGGADGGSAESRQALLIRSIYVTLRHPVFGVGMDNFHTLSLREQVSHNAYTQVSAEMGLAALGLYVGFMWSSLRRMRRIERETVGSKREARVHYLAVALQASLVGYMVSSFFASVAYLWYVYYLVGYALCLDRLYEALGASLFSRAPSAAAADDAGATAGPGI